MKGGIGSWWSFLENICKVEDVNRLLSIGQFFS